MEARVKRITCTLWPKPHVTAEDVEKLLRRLYSIRALVIKECNSYTDKTYYVKTTTPPVGSTETEFILKVLNAAFTSDCPGTVATQMEILNYLKTFPGLKCQVPVPTVDGKMFSCEIIQNDYRNGLSVQSIDELSAVRMCRYIQGRTLHDAAPLPPPFFYKAGRHLGDLQVALQTYRGDIEPLKRKGASTIWCLDNTPWVKRHLGVVSNTDRRKVLEEVLEDFERVVVPVHGELRKGIVHHDYSDHNVLVKQTATVENGPEEILDEFRTTGDDFEISGLIDFDLMVYTCLVNEIAVAMMYLMLCSDEPLEATAYLLAGFESRAPLLPNERRLLPALIAGRFAQSLVYGLLSAQLNPGNASYLCSTQARGWKYLELFLNQSDQNLMDLWDRIREQHDQ